MEALRRETQAGVQDGLVANGHGATVLKRALTHLAAGTMASTDLKAARKMYEAFFGLECAQYAPGRMMIRDRRAKWMMEHGERDFFVIDVEEVPAIEHPQKNLNHWGFSVGSKEEVDRIHTFARANMEEFRLAKVLPITPIHNAYGFYFYDHDSNWWEIEFRGGSTNESYFSRGTYDAGLSAVTVDDAKIQIAPTSAEVVGPEAFLTHGTTDVADVAKARLLYEQVLGLRSVQHVKIAQFTAGGGDFAFVGVETGKRHVAQTPTNRWVLLVDDDAKLEDIHRRALAERERFSIPQVTDPVRATGGYKSFLICSADENWFEISSRSPEDYRAVFERRDSVN